MAKKSANSEPPVQQEQPLANVNTTEIEVPQTMHIESDGPKEVPPDTSGEKPEIYDPNKKIMDEIYAKRRKQLEAENPIESGLESKESAADEIPVEEPASQAAKTVAQEPPVVSSPQVVQQPVAPTAGTIPEKVKIKVEGQELEVPYETLVTLAQKGLSAEQRWQEAAAMKQQAQQLMAPRQEEPPAKTNTASEILPKEKLADIVKRINYGSEEEQGKALLEYGAAIESKVRGEQKTPPTEQIVQVATQNAVSQIRFEQDQATIAKEYPEIFKDEGLSMLAGNISGRKVQQAQQTGQYRPIIDIWRESLNEVKSRYMPSATVPNPEPNAIPIAAVKVSDDKIERKRAAPKPPASANRVATEPAPQYGVNPGSIVNKMRQSRGQPVY